MSFSTQVAIWPAESSTLRELLGLGSGPKTQCCGVTTKHKQCKRGVSKSNSTLLARLLNQIAKSGSLDAARSLLAEASKLVMCQKDHQNQSTNQLKSWEQTLELFTDPHLKVEEEDSKSVLVELQEDSTNTQHVSLSSRTQHAKDEPTTTEKTIEEDQNNDIKSTSSVNKLKLASPKSPVSKVPTQHQFEPFNKRPLTLMALNKAIKKLIIRPLTKKERLTNGNIYIYVFPEHYHDSTPYIKIGYSNNVERRMAAWKNQCGYTPKILGRFHADSYVKVEKLVHTSLRNERVREASCPGCGKKHYEWFDTKCWEASSTIGLWTQWMRLVPYDEAGMLKEKWVKRLDRVDLSDAVCWQKFVSEPDAESDETECEGQRDDNVESDEEFKSNRSIDSGYYTGLSDVSDDDDDYE